MQALGKGCRVDSRKLTPHAQCLATIMATPLLLLDLLLHRPVWTCVVSDSDLYTDMSRFILAAGPGAAKPFANVHCECLECIYLRSASSCIVYSLAERPCLLQ